MDLYNIGMDIHVRWIWIYIDDRSRKPIALKCRGNELMIVGISVHCASSFTL